MPWRLLLCRPKWARRCPVRPRCWRTGSRSRSASTDPAGQTLTGFFAAYLAGSGELDRYLSPGTALAAVSPAPYTQVEVDRLAEVGTSDPGSAGPQSDGARRRLLVDITASDADGQKRPLTYAITITARDGRWEIASVEGAPVLSNEPAGTGTKETEQ
ncbi:conjugal transfer protein [Streptomyces sp. NPDC001880]